MSDEVGDKIEKIEYDFDTQAMVEILTEKVNEMIEVINDMWRHDG